MAKEDKIPDLEISPLKDEESFFYMHDEPELNRNVMEKHVRFARFVKEQPILLRPFYYLKMLLGWWVSFIPFYPFLGILAYYTQGTDYSWIEAPILAYLGFPLAILVSPLLILGGVIYAITSLLSFIVPMDIIHVFLYAIPILIFWYLIITNRKQLLAKVMRTSLPWKVKRF